MKFLFDENLSHALVEILARELPNCTHIRDIGLRSARMRTPPQLASSGEIATVGSGDIGHWPVRGRRFDRFASAFVKMDSTECTP